MEAMVQLKAQPPGRSLDNGSTANPEHSVATIGLAVQALTHDAATTPHEFCGWTDTTPLGRAQPLTTCDSQYSLMTTNPLPLVRAAMASASFVMSILAAAILTGSFASE